MKDRNLTFSEALDYLKEGKRIARNGWNGKTQYLSLGTNISFKDSNGDIVNHDNQTMGNKAIIFHGTIGTQVGWLASQGDLLSDDWYIVEDNTEGIYSVENTIKVLENLKIECYNNDACTGCKYIINGKCIITSDERPAYWEIRK